jgi:hypothetical protein
MRGRKEWRHATYLDRELLGKQRFARDFYDETGEPVGGREIHCIRRPSSLTSWLGPFGRGSKFPYSAFLDKKPHLEPRSN